MKSMLHIGLEGHIGPWSRGAECDRNEPYRKSVSFINCLPVDVAVATRDGMRFVLGRKSIIGESRLIVRVETTVNVEIRKQLLSLMNCRDIENSKELEIAGAFWKNQQNDPSQNYANSVIKIEYSIPMETLKRYGGTIYVKDIDYAFSIHGVKDDFYHPYSHAGEMIKGACDSVKDTLAELLENNSGDNNLSLDGSNFIRSIKIIDNAGTIGTRWTKIGNEIFVIRPHKQPDMRDGIYVLANSSVSNEVQKSELIATRYDTCDEVTHFKLHSSYLNALNDEVSAETRKAEIAIRELETREVESINRTRRAELENERLVAESDALRQEVENNQIKHKQEKDLLEKKIDALREERETNRIKEQQERAAARRKGMLDVLKTIPLVITAGFAIYAAMKKSQPKPT